MAERTVFYGSGCNQLACRMTIKGRDNQHLSTACCHNIGTNNLIGNIITAFYDNVRLQGRNKIKGCVLIKYRYGIDKGQCSQNGASGEIRVTAPSTNRSSITSPRTSMFLA